MQLLHIIRYVYPTYYTLRISYILYATYIGSSWSARKPSLRCIRCFSPRELIGTTPGSTTTTTPTINCCSLSTDDVTRGTTSRASLSSASSSTTTTRRLVHVNTALRERRGKKMRGLMIVRNTLNGHHRQCTVIWTQKFPYNCGEHDAMYVTLCKFWFRLSHTMT